jgi:hypothetical protein
MRIEIALQCENADSHKDAVRHSQLAFRLTPNQKIQYGVSYAAPNGKAQPKLR